MRQMHITAQMLKTKMQRYPTHSDQTHLKCQTPWAKITAFCSSTLWTPMPKHQWRRHQLPKQLQCKLKCIRICNQPSLLRRTQTIAVNSFQLIPSPSSSSKCKTVGTTSVKLDQWPHETITKEIAFWSHSQSWARLRCSRRRFIIADGAEPLLKKVTRQHISWISTNSSCCTLKRN